jgi:hypothetical protein
MVGKLRWALPLSGLLGAHRKNPEIDDRHGRQDSAATGCIVPSRRSATYNSTRKAMKSSGVLTFFVAATVAILGTGAASSSTIPSGISGTAPSKNIETQYALAECMTDDGYGRKRSCSANYKREHTNWRGSDDCMTDDGYGRKRSCSASYKAKHAK